MSSLTRSNGRLRNADATRGRRHDRCARAPRRRIGYVRDATDDGVVKRAASAALTRPFRRQHVTIHTADGPVSGVVGQTAIHLRDSDDDSVPEISEQHVDVGAVDGDEVESLVDRGDPVTFVQTLSELENGRLAARGMDNRIGIWAAAEGLRRAAESDADATVYAVSTVQEEVGVQGAKRSDSTSRPMSPSQRT